MKDIRAKILANKEVEPGFFKITLDAPYIARSACPGQFVQIRCSDTLDPFLRRPFSIHRIKDRGLRIKQLEIIYKVVGKGTQVLSGKRIGEYIDLLGPLGNGFTLPLSTYDLPPTAILIAGGMGVAPLVYLAEELKKEKIETIILIGAKTRKTLLCIKDFSKITPDVYIATDDGSKGHKGFVSKLLKNILQERLTTIYACGPNSMLRSIAEICMEHNVSCQVSLEEKMACGIGVCLGCVVKTKYGNKLVCKDGPVFNADEVIWQ